jgi:nucleoside-diphosphate-sugar epimerase
VYGAYEEQTERSHVVADFIHQALDNGFIKMIGDGYEKRDFVHVDQVCRHLWMSLNDKEYRIKKDRLCYSRQETNIYEIAEMIQLICECDCCNSSSALSKGLYDTVQLFKEKKGVL